MVVLVPPRTGGQNTEAKEVGSRRGGEKPRPWETRSNKPTPLECHLCAGRTHLLSCLQHPRNHRRAWHTLFHCPCPVSLFLTLSSPGSTGTTSAHLEASAETRGLLKAHSAAVTAGSTPALSAGAKETNLRGTGANPSLSSWWAQGKQGQVRDKGPSVGSELSAKVVLW